MDQLNPDPEFVPLAYQDAPVSILGASPRRADMSLDLMALGLGLSPIAALLSCYGEYIERQVALRTEHATGQARTALLMDLPIIDANAVWQLADGQLESASTAAADMTWQGAIEAARVLVANDAWIAARDREGRAQARVPALLARLSNEGTPNSSNGLAAGENRIAAEDRALLELIERDAVTVWWFNKAHRPALPLDLLSEQAGTADLLAWLQTRPRRTWHLDLTHDLATPVVAAIAVDADGRNPAYGFAARPTHAAAILGATMELIQSEFAHTIEDEARNLGLDRKGKRSWAYRRWSCQSSLATHDFLAPSATTPSNPALPADHPLDDRLIKAGLPAPLFVDLDRPDDPLRVVRAIVPGLCFWRARPRQTRIFTLPAQIGWHGRVDGPDFTEVILS